MPGSVLYWTSSGWKKGNLSQSSNKNPRPFTVSSFAAVDQIIERLADIQAFPGIARVVVAGHSAGGQFVNRYAAGGWSQATLAGARPDLSFRYIVTNPSSYLYVSPERAEDGAEDVFSVPDAQSCPGYNDYKYGLQDLNSYMSAVGADVIKQRYQSRRVVTFLGWNDNDPDHSSLDKSCSGLFQGDHRRERGEIHFNHIQKEFGAQVLDRHRLDYVPGVGHTGRGMFQSDCGLFHLYDHDPDATACTGQVVFADSFEGGLGNWVQDAQTAWLQSSARDDDGRFSAEIDGLVSDARLVSPEIILNGAASATVAFSWYIESGFDTGEYLAFDLSTDGGQTWVEGVSRLSGNVDQESTWHKVETNVSNVQSVILRFRATVSRSNEDAYVDNVYVTVNGSAEPPGGPANIAPRASFGFTPSAPLTGETVSFSDSSSDNDGTVMSWSWDFGDGIMSSARHPTHAYAVAGDYAVVLTVTDDGDASASATHIVSVNDPRDADTVDSLIGSSTGQGREWTATAAISLLDDGVPAQPVEGALVQGHWSLGPAPAECTTGADGRCAVVLSGIRKRNGSVTFMVEGASHDLLLFDNSAGQSSVVVSKP